MKFKYIPGTRPTPMLMYYNEPNIGVFNVEENVVFKSGNYTNKENHIWNIGAYIIYNNKLEILSYRISNPHNFIWLLRIINKEITIDFNDDFVQENKKFLDEISEELITM